MVRRNVLNIMMGRNHNFWGVLTLFTLFLGVCAPAEAGILSRLFGRGRERFLSGCSTGRCQPQVLRRNDRRVIRDDGRVRDVKRIPGLLRVGQGNRTGKQVLVELDELGRFRQTLFIDRNGNLFGSRTLRQGTKQEVLQTYLQALAENRIGRNDLSLVQNFVRANVGAVASGQLPVDLNGIDPEIPGVSAQEAMRKAMNFFFNLISSNNVPQPVRNALGADGRGVIDTTPFLKIEQLALLVNSNNPYACTGTFRMDQLVNSIADADLYHQLANIPQKLDDLARQRVVSEDLIGGRGAVGAYAKPDGKIARGPRVLKRQFQLRNGLAFYDSRDIITEPTGNTTNDRFGARDILSNPLAFAHDAGEYIYFKDNGFLAFGLYAANGDRQQTAPTNIVKERVQTPYDCMKCHQTGFRGGLKLPDDKDVGTVDIRPIILQNPNLSSFGKEIATKFYDANQYASYNVQDNDLMRKSLQQADAYIPSLLPDGKLRPGGEYNLTRHISEKYGAKLTLAQAAKELGQSPAALSANAAFRAALERDGQHITRKNFEKLFCSLYTGPNRAQSIFASTPRSFFSQRGAIAGSGLQRHDPGRRVIRTR